jgi:hypothetical protein
LAKQIIKTPYRENKNVIGRISDLDIAIIEMNDKGIV